jgi:putative transcriptional regulator
MKKSLGQTIAGRLNEFADTLAAGEDVSAKFTCRKVILKLEPQAYSPALVKKTRAVLSVSQGIFAKFLGVSVDAVQSWESGVNTPSDIACRFMDEIRTSPKFWRKRLRDLVQQKVNDKCEV